MRTRIPVLVALALTSCVHRGALPLRETERASGVVKFQAGQQVPPVLRQKADAISPTDPALPALVASMLAELEKSGGVGLAAPQVGVSRRVALVKRHTRPKGEITVEVYVNPVIEQRSAEKDLDWEACLSVEGGGGQVERFRSLVLSHDPVGGGARLRTALSDWDARIAQHELDHLDGVLFVDKLVGSLVSTEEMRSRRDEEHRRRGWLPPAAPPSPGP